MKKICSLFVAFAMFFSITSVAANDYSLYTPVEGVGHYVDFNADYSSLLAINGDVETKDVAGCPVDVADSGADGNVLKLNLSGSYSSAPYVASGDSGNGMLSYEQSKDMVVRVSMDMALSDPSLVWSFFQTKGWVSSGSNTWKNSYAQMQVSNGKLIAAGKTVSSVTIEPDVFYNYMMIIDIAQGMAYFYFNGELVHENSLSGSEMLGFARWASNFPKSYSKDTYAYFDNITLQTITNSFTAQLDAGDNPNACPYENPDIRIRFSDDIDTTTLSMMTVKSQAGKTVTFSSEYDEGKRECIISAMSLSPATKYLIDISAVRGKNGATPSGTTVFEFATEYAKAPDIQELAVILGAGHDINFDSDYSDSIVTSGNAEVTDQGGQYGKVLRLSLSGTYDSAPYVASSDSGSGILTYKQSADKIAMISMDMMLSDVSSAWNFFQTKGWSSATSNTWMNGYAQMQVSNGKLVAAGDVVPGVEIKPDVFYNYMMIVDVPGKMVYFYVDNNLVHQKSIDGSGMLGYARWAASFPKTYAKDTYAYFDNIKLRVLSRGYTAQLSYGIDADAVPYDGTAQLAVEFSDEMNPSTMATVSMLDTDGNEVFSEGAYDASQNKYVFAKASLKANAEYRIDLSGVCNADGVGMNGSYPYITFKTQKPPVYIKHCESSTEKTEVDIINRTDDATDIILIASYYNKDKFVLCSSQQAVVSGGQSKITLTGKPTDCDEVVLYLVYIDNLNLIDKYKEE